MFMQGLLTGELVGLLHRRRKWHLAEYNRIVASLGGTPPAQAAILNFAAMQHSIGMTELDMCIKRLEPPWGPERKVTERFLPPEEKADESGDTEALEVRVTQGPEQ